MAQNPIDPKDAEKVKKELEEIVKISAEAEYSFLRTRDASKAMIESMSGSSELVKRIGTFGTQIKNSFIDISQLAAKLGTEYIKTEQVQKRISQNEGLQTEMKAMQTKMLEEYNKKLTGGRVSAEQAILAIQKKVEKSGEVSLEDDEKKFYILNQYIESLKEQEKILAQINEKVESGNTEFSKMAVKGTALKKIFDQLSFIPILSSFMRFDIISDKFLVSKKEGFKELGKQIKTIVTSPMFLLAMGLIAIVSAMKALIKATFEFDKQLVQISNNMGISREASIGLLDNFREISNNNAVIVKGLDSAFLSVKNQAAATSELQEILETNSLFTSKMVQSQILLTKQMGLSKEESAGIQKLSILTGKSADDILKNAINQNKTAISYRKIISDISKVNSEISVMYKNNPDLIAKAVIEANKLGLSLDDTQKIAKSLLDFETSISGELEAELLTGRRFNFEKARALALDGKSVEAAKELVDQMGGLNGLTKLNVIQRERLAASIGLSAEELTKSAREAEILKNLGFENRNALEEQYELMRQRNDQAGLAALMEAARKKEGGEILLKDIARASLQQRFEESVERIKQLFTEIAAGPLTRIINGIVKFLSNASALKAVLVGMSAVFGAIAVSAIAAAVAMTIASGGSNLVAAAAVGGGLLLGGGLAAAALYSSGGDEGVETPQTAQMPGREYGPSSYNTPATPGREYGNAYNNKPSTPSMTGTDYGNAYNNKPSTPSMTGTEYNNAYYNTSSTPSIPGREYGNAYYNTSSTPSMKGAEYNNAYYNTPSTPSMTGTEYANVYYNKPSTPTKRMYEERGMEDLKNRIYSLENNTPLVSASTSSTSTNYSSEASETSYKDFVKLTETVKPKSPEMYKVPEVPYTTTIPSSSGRDDLEKYKKSIGSADTPKKSVIQNNISLIVDGKQMATVLNMIPSDIA
jgi:hypothetical protein